MIGIKVSQSGDDIKTADEKNLVFSSKYRTPKVWKSGSVSVAAAGSEVVNHNLGYIPKLLVYELASGSNNVEFGNHIVPEIDTNKITLRNGGVADHTAYYFIFIDEVI